ncbi:serine/threonine-protein kinase Nek11 isoform X2 [Mus caroli]|uniref:Serine/threonine-protein kinase Nek11 n=1 Tax=Mus caroli TaxID=10089 RepID=A0A6P5QCA5_MUSCR|nr:serine/threonine-protein kinase Nek11 isoform X2 [Mus caroli]
MLKFQETAKCVSGGPTVIPMYPTTLIARRYVLQQKLGSGSFGTVYLVSDKKAKPGEELKVLKEISVGELNPNETVQANVEAQLLSRLHHPTIVRFHESFVEQETFCIITEYCEGRDLDYKIQEYKEAGKVFAENQIVEWFIQLLLGVDYMHERRILHRDLKSKNIFLKNNLLKIGDFGVSRLLMGSCELATTLTGTPHYMSPEALKHQGYDAKSDICMLNKSPSLRPSAADILKAPYMEEQLQLLMCKYPEMTLEDKNSVCQKEAAHTINAVQRKLHLQTLQALSDAQKTTPRERMRLRKLQAADERARRLKKIAEENYKENDKRMQALRSQNVGSMRAHVLHELDERTLESLPEPQSLPCLDLDELEPSLEDTIVDPGHSEIPEDPLVAEQYYSDVFDSCSEDSEEQEEEMIFSEAGGDTKEEESPSVYRTNQQDSDAAALVGCLEHVLGYTSLDTKTITNAVTDMSPGPMVFNSAVARTKMKRMKESAVQKLGVETFQEVYDYLKRARHQNAREAEIWEHLETVVPRASDCFEVDQLLYFEELLLTMEGKEPSLQNLYCEAAQKKPVKGTHFCDNP